MTIGRVGNAGFGQQRVRDPCVEALLVIAADATAEQLGGIDQDDGRGVDPAEHHARCRGVRIDHDGPDRMREIAGLAADLGIAPVRGNRPHRDMDRFDDLARAQHRFQRAKNEFFDCDIPRTGAAAQRQARAQRGQRGYPVRGRISMAELAADRAAVADRTISDVRSDNAHRPVRYIGRAAILDVGMGNAGAKHQLVVAPLSLLQLGQRRDVDDMSGCTSRRLSIGPSDWPPAMILAEPRASTSSDSASCRSRGRS